MKSKLKQCMSNSAVQRIRGVPKRIRIPFKQSLENVFRMYLILATISFSETSNKLVTRIYHKRDDIVFE